MSLPMLLLWGDADPWIVPARAEKVRCMEWLQWILVY